MYDDVPWKKIFFLSKIVGFILSVTVLKYMLGVSNEDLCKMITGHMYILNPSTLHSNRLKVLPAVCHFLYYY